MVDYNVLSTSILQHMVKMSYDVVKRWVNEAQEAASSDNIMVQVGRNRRKTTELLLSSAVCFIWLILRIKNIIPE